MNILSRRSRVCVLLLVVAAAASIAAAAAQASIDSRHATRAVAAYTGASANPATYTDPTGDNGSAPDVTTVVVSNNASNEIKFRINSASLVVPSDNRVLIAIDSDQSAATGASGLDYLVLVDLSNNSFDVGHWNGSGFDEAAAPSATASSDNGGVTFSIASSDLGNTTGFNFWVRTLHGQNVAAGTHDDAPDAGTWNYQLGPASALKLTVQLAHATKAKAGKPFVAVITVTRSDGSPATVTVDDVSCTAKIGARLLHGRAVAIGPAVGCSWRLPKSSKGKTVRATVTVNLDGATVAKTFVARIK